MVNMAPTWRPKSYQKRPKTVPTLSQMEPKMLPNQFFKAILGVFFLCRNLHRLFMDCLMIFCYLSRAQHIKNHGFSQVKCYILQNQLFRRKCPKIFKNFQNHSKIKQKCMPNRRKSLPSRPKIEIKSKKIAQKMQNGLRCPKVRPRSAQVPPLAGGRPLPRRPTP